MLTVTNKCNTNLEVCQCLAANSRSTWAGGRRTRTRLRPSSGGEKLNLNCGEVRQRCWQCAAGAAAGATGVVAVAGGPGTGWHCLTVTVDTG